jgi:HlyD family secretion protein
MAPDTNVPDTRPSELPIPLVGCESGDPILSARLRRRWRRAGLTAAAVAAATAGLWPTIAQHSAPSAVPPNDAARLPPGNIAPYLPTGTIVGLGKLLPRSRIVVVAAPYGSGDARIAMLQAQGGQRVEVGGTLAVLNNEPKLRAAMDWAEAAVVQVRVVAAPARDDARASLARAEAAILANRRDLDRALALVARGI